MNILITGGLGYIGGRIATHLKEKEQGAKIFLTTRDKNKKLPSWTDGFKVLQMDILDEGSITDCFKDKKIDIIIHLAALNEIDSMKDPEHALKVNTYGTYKLLNMAKTSGISRFVYFSTFHVYGKTSDTVITEETPTRPFHPYAITHRSAEDFVNYFQRYHGLETLIFRLSNGYGYAMDKYIDRWSLVFNDLCRQAITTGRIVLKSSGRQHRDFISLSNVTRAVYHFLFVVLGKWGDGLYNLGGNCSMSILDVAQTVTDVYAKKYSKSIPEISTKPDKDPVDYNPVHYSIEKLQKTGFHLEGNMALEIEKTMELCEDFHN